MFNILTINIPNNHRIVVNDKFLFISFLLSIIDYRSSLISYFSSLISHLSAFTWICNFILMLSFVVKVTVILRICVKIEEGRIIIIC